MNKKTKSCPKCLTVQIIIAKKLAESFFFFFFLGKETKQTKLIGLRSGIKADVSQLNLHYFMDNMH